MIKSFRRTYLSLNRMLHWRFIVQNVLKTVDALEFNDMRCSI